MNQPPASAATSLSAKNWAWRGLSEERALSCCKVVVVVVIVVRKVKGVKCGVKCVFIHSVESGDPSPQCKFPKVLA